MRPLNILTASSESGWDLVMQWKESATNPVEILPTENSRSDLALYQSQLSTETPIGSIIYHCGGILIDHGWIRILGSGCNRIDRSLPSWNKGKSINEYGEDYPFLLVADDVAGGLFAINTGGIDSYNIGKIYYYSPNKLIWETTGLGYNEFIVFCFSGNVENFYHDFRWKGWEDDIHKLNGSQVVSCYPKLWTDSGRELQCNRKTVSIDDQWNMYPKTKLAAKENSNKKMYAKKKSTKNR